MMAWAMLSAVLVMLGHYTGIASLRNIGGVMVVMTCMFVQ